MHGELALFLALVAQAPAAPEDGGPLIGEAVARFARDHMGQTVGGGECSDLAVAALEAAGAELPVYDVGEPIWGDQIEKRSELKPGDVIQFRDAVFLGRRRTGEGFSIYRAEYPHHTAIVEKVLDDGRRLVILHQNAGPAEVSEEERRAVRRDTLRMADLRPGGRVLFYRPRSTP